MSDKKIVIKNRFDLVLAAVVKARRMQIVNKNYENNFEEKKSKYTILALKEIKKEFFNKEIIFSTK